MTEITEKQIEHLAELSALELSSEEINKMKNELGNILKFANKVQSVDVKENVVDKNFVTLNSLREDKSEQGLTNEQALMNAPKKENGYYVVSKVVD